jgi:hypothetical protein
MVKQPKKDEYDIKDDIRDIRNRIDKIMGDTHNISRILTLGDRDTIKKDISEVIAKSPKRAALLMLTKDYVDREALCKAIKTDDRNLNSFLNPLLEKGYISDTKDGRKKLYKRSEIVDLIGYEKIPEFSKLVKDWEASNSDTKSP